MLSNVVVRFQFSRVSGGFVVMEHFQDVPSQGDIVRYIQFFLVIKDVVFVNSFYFPIFQVGEERGRFVLFQGEVNGINAGINVFHIAYSLL